MDQSTELSNVVIGNLQKSNDRTTTSNVDFPIDNLNVIYDNDTAITGLAYDELSANASKIGQLLPVVGGGIDQRDDVQVATNETQIAHERRKQTNNIPSSFVNFDGVEGDEAVGGQDNLAICRLLSSNGNNSLVGRLSFWQPKEGRGATHLVARFKYTWPVVMATDTTTVTIITPARFERQKRESFTVPIERELPPNQVVASNTADSSSLLSHKIWLISADANTTETTTTGADILLAELRVPKPAGSSELTIDVDAESVIGKEFHLSGEKSIVGKELLLTVTGYRLAKCNLEISQSIPPQDELDHSPSVSINHPTRDDLLLQQHPQSLGK